MVYVDEIIDWGATVPSALARRCGTKWCHMYADTEEELHTLAERIGLKRSWFQNKKWPHYDLTPGMRKKAVQHGAVEQTAREMVRFVRNRDGSK